MRFTKCCKFSKLTGTGRESEARGKWAGIAVSLAQNAPPPADRDAIAVSAAEPSQLLARCARSNTPPRYATCNEIPGYQDYWRGKPLHLLYRSLTPTAPAYLRLTRAESWNGFPFYRWNVGKRVLVSQLSLSICKCLQGGAQMWKYLRTVHCKDMNTDFSHIGFCVI